MLRTAVVACVSIVLAVSGGAARAQSLPQIWLAPPDDMPRRAGQPPGQTGFAALFRPGAPWQRALRDVKVFELNAFYAMHAPPAALRTLFAYLRAHHVALASGFGPLYGHDGCGMQVEGYSAPGTSAAVAQRIAKLGGRLDYANMDEPLFYGHFYTGRNACRESIAEVARLAALGAAQLRTVFPAVQIGDTEPTAKIDPTVVAQWLAAYRAAAGRPLAFYQLDVQWNIAWQSLAIAQVRAVRREGVPVGVIYNSGPSVRTSAAWVQDAVANYQNFERLLGHPPPLAIFASWTALPRRTLPDGDPATLTGLLLHYVQAHGGR